MNELLNEAADLIRAYDNLDYHYRWETIAPLQDVVRKMLPLLDGDVRTRVEKLVNDPCRQMDSLKAAVVFAKAANSIGYVR